MKIAAVSLKLAVIGFHKVGGTRFQKANGHLEVGARKNDIHTFLSVLLKVLLA